MKLLGDTKEGKSHPDSKFCNGSKPKLVSHCHAPHRNASAPFLWDGHVLTTHALLRAKAWGTKHGGHGRKYGINELLSHVSFQRDARMLGSSKDGLLTGWGKHCCRERCVSGVLLEYVQTPLNKMCKMQEDTQTLPFILSQVLPQA